MTCSTCNQSVYEDAVVSLYFLEVSYEIGCSRFGFCSLGFASVARSKHLKDTQNQDEHEGNSTERQETEALKLCSVNINSLGITQMQQGKKIFLHTLRSHFQYFPILVICLDCSGR